MADEEVLVGDIGGTNARFAIAAPGGSLRRVEVLKVASHHSFDEALAAYLSGLGSHPQTLCIASAGALQGDSIHLTNAAWTLGETALAKRFGFRAVRLINDFQAQARFAGGMGQQEGETLKPGAPVPGAPVLTVGPGTGFGQALFVPGRPAKVVATEGGHRLLPVRSAVELALYERLKDRLGHEPILEDALSGRGLASLFEACVLAEGATPEPTEPAEVTAAALAGEGPARAAVLWFLDLLAAASADACLATGARGGVVVSGGIVPRLLPLLGRQSFAATFARKGILQRYLSEVPVRMVTDPYAALRGAAWIASEA